MLGLLVISTQKDKITGAVVAGECGDDITDPGEECDDGTQCLDGTQCTADDDCSDITSCLEGATAICHTPNNGVTHTVCLTDQEAINAHLEHGDTVGVCDSSCLPRDEDGCTFDCKSEEYSDIQLTTAIGQCGNGVVDSGEECDDGKHCQNGSSCNSPLDCGANATSCTPSKTLVCHIPPGNPGNKHTICVANPSVPAHLAHGDYLGTCSEHTCEPRDGDCCDSSCQLESQCIGACCYPDESCTEENENDCLSYGGNYQGNGTLCSQVDCSTPQTGACCYENDCAGEVTQDTCENTLGGVYQGDGSICDQADCSLTGACCDDGECIDDVSQGLCEEEIGGEYQGDGTICSQVDCDGEEGEYDLGDAPDSTNNHQDAQMTAYPIFGPPGTQGDFPTVHNGPSPFGPCHNNFFAVLGREISFEDEADLPPDQDITTNIIPPPDYPDNDSISLPFTMDDSLRHVPIDPSTNALVLPHCQQVTIPVEVTTTGTAEGSWTAHLNIWIDYNRDGDWGTPSTGDTVTCSAIDDTPEWVVQNYAIPVPAAGFGTKIFNVTFTGYVPSQGGYGPPDNSWVRVQLTPEYIELEDGSGPGEEFCDEVFTIDNNGCGDGIGTQNGIYGACCFPDGSCVDGMCSVSCPSAGGVFQGPGTICSQVECPNGENGCEEIPGECYEDGETEDYYVNIQSPPESGIQSDDFNRCELGDFWTYVDPKNDSTFELTGTQASFFVPAGVEHQLWTNGMEAPHIIQPASDVDFEVEVKFDSSVDSQYQEQGIIVKQDDMHLLRFEFYSTNSNTKLFSATLQGAGFPLTSTIHYNNNIGGTGISPLWMRVKREGNMWTQSYSTDGSFWTNAVTFTHPMTVNYVGVYGGNAIGGGSPSHTALVDYFFNTNNPIDPEDPTQLDCDCPDADYVFPINAQICGAGCFIGPSCPPEDNVTVSLTTGGKYSVKASATRGGKGPQLNEVYHLLVKGQSGPVSPDDVGDVESIRIDPLGSFNFNAGSNIVSFVTDAMCPPEEATESVAFDKLCLKKIPPRRRPSGGGGGGGGGAYTTRRTVRMDDGMNDTGFYTLRGFQKTQAATYTHKGDVHTIKIVNIDHRNDLITIEVTSTPQQFTIGVGQTVEVDLDGNGYNDVAITMSKLNYVDATITVTKLKEDIPPVVEEPKPVVEEKPKPKAKPKPKSEPKKEVVQEQPAKIEKTKSRSYLWYGILLLLVMIAIAALLKFKPDLFGTVPRRHERIVSKAPVKRSKPTKHHEFAKLWNKTLNELTKEEKRIEKKIKKATKKPKTKKSKKTSKKSFSKMWEKGWDEIEKEEKKIVKKFKAKPKKKAKNPRRARKKK